MKEMIDQKSQKGKYKMGADNLRYGVMLTVLMAVFFVLVGCGSRIDQEVAKYKGEGVIRKLKSPGLLGVSGCSVAMPHFDLSQPFQTRYDLSGLPQMDQCYVVYLILPGIYREEIPVTLSLQIFRDGECIRSLSSASEKMANSFGGEYGAGSNRYYFPDQGFIMCTGGTNKWSLIISCTNSQLSEVSDSFIFVSAGGFK